jgi:hypothetical protein
MLSSQRKLLENIFANNDSFCSSSHLIHDMHQELQKKKISFIMKAVLKAQNIFHTSFE